MSVDRFILLEPGEARPTRIPLPPAFEVKATTGDTEGRFSLLEVRVALDIPRHTHFQEDECVYVLDGVLEIEFAGRKYSVTKGMCLLLPHGVPHAIRRVTEQVPRVLQISSPGGWERVVEDMIEAGPAVMSDGKLDPAKMKPIAARHHLEYEGQQ